MDESHTYQLHVDRGALADAIHEAFVESRFSAVRGSRYVTIHLDGRIVGSKFWPTQGLNEPRMVSIECAGSPQIPDEGSVGAQWTRDEFLLWVRSRDDLYLLPSLEEFRYQAQRQGILIVLNEHDH